MSDPKPPAPHKRNRPAEERRRELLEAAIDLFAERGMRITLQALADRVNVTQPLVHHYFPARDDLIAAIRDALQNAHWDPQWRREIEDRAQPLTRRLERFYELYAPGIYQQRWYRGFWFAALEDASFAQSYLDHVQRELLDAIIAETRAEFGHPPPCDLPIAGREKELAWSLHAATVVIGMRRYIYQAPIYADPAAVVRDQIFGYLKSAERVLSELMPAVKVGNSAPASGD